LSPPCGCVAFPGSTEPEPVTLRSWSGGHNQLVTTSRIGLFLIRAWVEPGSSSPLRAHIRRTTDVSQGFEQGLIVADKEAVVAAVRAWLSEVLADSLTDEDDPDRLSDT
jgi:hypothetical protein